MVASGLGAAQFFFDLLSGSSSAPVLPPMSVDGMMDFHTLDRGWATGYMQYGAGLMIQNVSPNESQEAYKQHKLPTLTERGSYVGHAGDTWV